MKKPLSLILLSSLFIISACDEAPEADDDLTFRSGYKPLKAKTASTVFVSRGTDDPTINGGDPIPGWPLHEVEIEAVVRNADAIYASAFAASEESDLLCPKVCDVEGLSWTGRVAASGEYEVGEVVWSKLESGQSYETEINGKVDMECLCFAE